MAERLLGYSETELARNPLASFFQPELAPLQPQVAEALWAGPQAHELFPPVDEASSITEHGYLWHPKAHINARWADGLRDESYIGCTSLITVLANSS